MAGTERVEVLCAAHLKGKRETQGRYDFYRLTVAAVARTEKIEVTAAVSVVKDFYSRYSSGENRLLWSFSSSPRTEAEAVAQVKAIAENPADAFERGQVHGKSEQPEAVKAFFLGLKIQFFVDRTQGESDLAGDAITVGMGRYLAAQVEQGAALTPELRAGIERYLSQAPFSYGYWAPYKRLIKLLEANAHAASLLAVALARVDGQLRQVANVQANDQLPYEFGSLLPSLETSVAGPATVAYMMRRGRRWLRRLGRTDPDGYVRFASAFLQAADTQSTHATIARRWILADILYGRGASNTSHGRGSLTLPDAQPRYNRRWDRFHRAWNEHIDTVCGIWRKTEYNSDIQIWAFNVLKSQRQELPRLRVAGLRLALLSPSDRLRAYACAEVAARPERLMELDAGTVQMFLECGSAKQFSAVYPALEANPHATVIQQAVLAYIGEHGLSEIRRGSMPLETGKRQAMLLRYSLRFLRSQFSAADTFQLALYVGKTTQFKPLAQWRDTLSALPLKSLVELRLHLPNLSKTVARSIDGACKEAVAKGADREDLAAALTLSPSHELRALAWTLLANAGDETVATVWNNLVAQAGSARGLEFLLEALRFKGRIERIERHESSARLLSLLAIATAIVDPKLAKNLLLRLATKGDSRQTLDTLDRIFERMEDGGWATRPAVLKKLNALDPALTRLVWLGVGGASHSPVAQIHLATTTLAGALVDAINSDEIKTVGSVQAGYLAQALRVSPSRLYRERGFAVACATSPHPELQQLVIARLESRGLVQSVYVPLAESGMPAALAAAERYIASIKDRTGFTKAVITVCDSGAISARAIGLRFIEDQRDRLDLNALLVALVEHTSSDVTAVMANFAASGVAVNRDALDQFDNRILRTRRTGRKAKELVKRRLETLVPDAATSVGANHTVDDRRIQALVDMARGSSLRDRDWALQQLARLALDGHPIPQLQVSATS